MWLSPSRSAADHSPLPVVNRDASHSFAGRDNDGRAQRARAGREGSPGSAGRRLFVRRLWHDGRSQRRNRCGHDRSGCRSPPERGSGHRRTAAPGWDHPRGTDTAVDDGRGKSCDIAPACVPRHGVVHGAEAEPASWLGAVLATNRVAPPPPAPARSIQCCRFHQGLRAERRRSSRGAPADFMPKLGRRQIYADSDRQRHAATRDTLVLDHAPVIVRLSVLLARGLPQKHDPANLAIGI